MNQFSVAEQSAMSLDGEVYNIGRGYLVIDVPPCTLARIAVLSKGSPRHSALCGITAAWAYGAHTQPPPRIDVCNIPGHKAVKSQESIFRTRELALGTADIATYHRWHVTTPERTVVDLLKASVQEPSKAQFVDAIRNLVHLYSLDVNAIVEQLQRSPRMPYKNALLALARTLATPREHDKRHIPHRFYEPN